MDSLFSLRDKVCVVTGASSGIGLAVSEGLAAQGGSVVMVYNSTNVVEQAQQLAKVYGVTVEARQCDLGNPSAIEVLVNEVVEAYGRIDVFVANAGVAWRSGSATNFESNAKLVEGYTRFMDMDLSSVYYCCAHVGRQFEKQKSGSLILTGSMSGIAVNTPQHQAAYNAAKAAVIQLGKSLAYEWSPYARVNVVSPGYVETRLTSGINETLRAEWLAKTPLGRMARPRELVGAYVYLASDASSFTTGSNVVVDGGYSAL